MWMSILAAALANIVVGYVWYHPRLFGATWMRLANVTPEMAEKGSRRMLLYNMVAFAAALVTAGVLWFLMQRIVIESVSEAILFAFLLWLGVAMPVALGQFLWDHKPLALFALNATYVLVALEVMTIVVYL